MIRHFKEYQILYIPTLLVGIIARFIFKQTIAVTTVVMLIAFILCCLFAIIYVIWLFSWGPLNDFHKDPYLTFKKGGAMNIIKKIICIITEVCIIVIFLIYPFFAIGSEKAVLKLTGIGLLSWDAVIVLLMVIYNLSRKNDKKNPPPPIEYCIAKKCFKCYV